MLPTILPQFSAAALRQSYSAPIPPALGWDQTNFPLSISLIDYDQGRRSLGSVTLDPRTFPSYAACLAGLTVWASPSGSDATGNGSQASPYRSIWKAQQAVNASAAPGTVKVVGGSPGIYTKDQNFSISVSTNVPTVDTLYMATGGRVVSHTAGNVTWAADTTPCCSTATRSSVYRVVDLLTKDRDGIYREFVNVSSAALCRLLPWTWNLTGTTLIVNRGDGLTAADANTRAYLNLTNFQATGVALNLFFVGQNPGDGFDFEGGTAGALNGSFTTAGAVPKVIFASDCTFRYAGAYGTTNNGNGISVNSFVGLAMFDKCDASANQSDGFNFHDVHALGGCYFLTVNCSGYRAGLPGSVSNNGWTAHEGTIGIDVAGLYSDGAGCTAHVIDTVKAFMAGTTCRKSRGDIALGGGFLPSEFRTAGTAQMWCFNTRAQPANSGAWAYQATDSSTIRKRTAWPTDGVDCFSGSATVGTY